MHCPVHSKQTLELGLQGDHKGKEGCGIEGRERAREIGKDFLQGSSSPSWDAAMLLNAQQQHLMAVAQSRQCPHQHGEALGLER